MREIFEQRLLAAFKGGKEVSRRWSEMEKKVRSGEITPTAAAESSAVSPASAKASLAPLEIALPSDV